MKIFMTIILLVTTINIFAQQKSIDSCFIDCMQKHTDTADNNFYTVLLNYEDTLINYKILKGKSKTNYVELYKKIFLSSDSSYEKTKIKIKQIVDDDIFYQGIYALFFYCDIIDTSQVGLSKYVYINMYKLILSQYITNNTKRFAENLLIATNFDSNIMRMNLLSVFLLETVKR